MEVGLFEGGERISLTIPDGSLIETIDIPYSPPLKDPEAAILNTLRHPVESPPLSALAAGLAAGKGRVVVVIPDRTRPAPLNLVLRLVLTELHEGGVTPSAITIIIGIGTHRPMNEAEIADHVGEDIVRSYRVMNHRWWEKEELVELGVTRNGTPIQVSRWVAEADLTVAVGGVKPHGVVGWSGGAKMIQPAVSGFEATGITHWLSAKVQCSGALIIGTTDNPVRAEMEEFAGIAGLDFIVNYVLNSEYEMLGVFSGHYVKAHRACVELARPKFTYTCRSNEPADVLLVGTSKAQGNMWALGTGPCWAGSVLKRGGTIVLVAPCPDGVAEEHPDVLAYGYRPFEEVAALVEEGRIKDLAAADHIARCGSYVRRKDLRCILVSKGVSRAEAKRLGMEHVASAQEAVEMALKRHGAQARFSLHPGGTFAGLLVERGD
jgi:nickel-dependent lactate racemase